MKTLMIALTLAALIADPAFGQSAKARRPGDRANERARIIQKCMAMNRQHNNDPYDAKAGVEYMYQACMANHGQPP
jgi:hypothetical protein